jgi:hypothetical protein
VMFFVCFFLYACLFGYIMNKNPWLKHHGLYINVFSFQMLVLLCKCNNQRLDVYSPWALLRGVQPSG